MPEKGRSEGEGQKEHQAMKIERVRAHFCLHTAVKESDPSEHRVAAASRADESSGRFTSSQSSTFISL